MEDFQGRKELKAGDTKTYSVKGQTLTLEPLPIGKLKRVIDVLSTPDREDFAKTIADYILLVFDVEQHDFLTKEWIEKNVTLPDYNQIVVDAARINGLPRFLNQETQPTETRALMETETGGNQNQPIHSDLVTSTTPSASPTNGQ